MVNMRATLDAAMAEGSLVRGLAARLTEIGLFYKQWSWPAILRLADRRLLFEVSRNGCPAAKSIRSVGAHWK